MSEPGGVEEIMRALQDARSELTAREQAVATTMHLLRSANDVAKEIMQNRTQSQLP